MNTGCMPDWRIWISAGVIAVCGNLACAQTESEAVLEALVAALDSDDYAERELAGTTLQQLEGFNRAALTEILTSRELSLEQRQRLEAIALKLFENEPRAGLGVQFGQEGGPFGAQIAATVQGFDASNWLKPGDLIVAVDGRPIRHWEDLRLSIISRTPGEKLPMTVVRDDQQLDVAPMLGSYADLRTTRPLSVQDLMNAWRMWSERIGMDIKSEPTIEVQVDADSTWGFEAPAPGRLTLGGSVRSIEGYAGVSGTRVFIDNNNPNMRVQIIENGRVINPGQIEIRNPAQLQIMAIDDQLVVLRLQLRILQQMLQTAEGNARAEFEKEISEIEAQIDGFERRRLELGGK